MLFNSIDFAIFLPVVFLLYWFVFAKNLRGQNLLVVLASYCFYGWWDWRFLSLIFLSTLVDFTVGIGLSRTERPKSRKYLLACSIAVNLGLLGFFKYHAFFLENFVAAFSLFGQEIGAKSLQLILPVGISFYTFQTLSYTIDVYRKQLEPSRDFVAFAAFVSFFPQLVAGPIERAKNLLPQLGIKRRFDYDQAADGMRQILWGLFKKMVIADNCGRYVDLIFGAPETFGASTLLLGAVFFAFQIYGDFSGYSDIAIGTARLFGFHLSRNFAFPYFSRDMAEFWRRWHISLSTWFRDYLYIPLGGSKVAIWKQVRNVFIIFLVSGFWHGANWTFVAWGALNALYFLPLLLVGRNRKNMEIVAKGKWLPTLRDLFAMCSTFALSVLAWIFFRADSIMDAVSYIVGMISLSMFTWPEIEAHKLMVCMVFFVFVEWIGREGEHAIEHLGMKRHPIFRFGFYYVLLLAIFWFGGTGQEFIYFQF